MITDIAFNDLFKASSYMDATLSDYNHSRVTKKKLISTLSQLS